MTAQTVLVFAGTGARGRPVVSELLARGHRVRLVVSQKADPHATEQENLEIVEGNLADPPSLLATSAGIDSVALQLPVWVDDVAVARGAVEAAQEAGAKRIVFVAHTAVPDGPVGVVRPDVMREIDSYIRSLGKQATVLRAPLYLGNLTVPGIARAILDDGTLAYPLAADARCPWITFEDAAACLVAALEDDSTAGEVLPIGGPESLTGDELADRVGTALDRNVEYREVPVDAFIAQMTPRLGERVAGLVGEMYRYLSSAEGRPFLDLPAASTLARLGIEGTPVVAWAQAQAWDALAAPARAAS